METRENCKKLSFLNFPQFSAVFPSFSQFFFGRRRLKKRSEKTEIARSKRRHRKGGGQAAAKKRSPLRRMWNRGRARSAKVHACGAQLKGEFQEISRECEGARSPKVHACGAQLNREIQEISRECEGGLKIKDARAGALEAPYGCWRTAAEKRKRPKSVELPRPSVMDGTKERKS